MHCSTHDDRARGYGAHVKLKMRLRVSGPASLAWPERKWHSRDSCAFKTGQAAIANQAHWGGVNGGGRCRILQVYDKVLPNQAFSTKL